MTPSEARIDLVNSARLYCKLYSWYQWLHEIAPSIALTKVSQKELDAIYNLFWNSKEKHRY